MDSSNFMDKGVGTSDFILEQLDEMNAEGRCVWPSSFWGGVARASRGSCLRGVRMPWALVRSGVSATLLGRLQGWTQYMS